MIATVIKQFRDKDTGVLYNVGQTIDRTTERIVELVQGGYVEIGQQGNKDVMVATYAELMMAVQYKAQDRMYQFTVEADEVNGGGLPAVYLVKNENMVRLVPQEI